MIRVFVRVHACMSARVCLTTFICAYPSQEKHLHSECAKEAATVNKLYDGNKDDELDSEVALEQTDWHTDTAAAQSGTDIITRLQSFIVQFETATTICSTVLARTQQQQQDMHALRQRVQLLLHELALQRREKNIYKMREKVLLSRSSRLRDSLSSLGAQGEKGSDREQTLASQLGLQLKDLQVLNAGLEEEMATAQAETGLKEQMLVDMRKALDKKEALQQELLADLSHAASELVRTRLELGIAQEHSARQTGERLALEKQTAGLQSQLLLANAAMETCMHEAERLAWEVEGLEGELASSEARVFSNKDAPHRCS